MEKLANRLQQGKRDHKSFDTVDLSALATIRDEAVMQGKINDQDPTKSHYIKTQDKDRFYYGNFTVDERLYLRKTRKPANYKQLFFDKDGTGDSGIIQPDELVREDYPVQVSIPARFIRRFSRNMPTLPPPRHLIPTRKTYDPKQSLDLLSHCHQGYWPFLERGFYEGRFSHLHQANYKNKGPQKVSPLTVPELEKHRIGERATVHRFKDPLAFLDL